MCPLYITWIIIKIKKDNMSITVKTDVKVRDENTSDLQADAMCTMILLNDIQKNMSDKRRELLEEGIVNLPTTTVIGGIPVQTMSTSSVDETDEIKEENPLNEEDLKEIAYAEAMIAAMSAIGENLSKTIDMSSERSVLLKKLSDASIEMAQQNLEDAIQDIKDQRKAEKKAKKAERRGSIFSRVVAGLSIAAGAAMCATGVGAVAGGVLIATSVGMLIADETGGTEAAVKGIAKGMVDAGWMNEQDAAIVASVAFAVGVMAAGGGLSKAGSMGANAMAKGAANARLGFEAASEAAGSAASISSKAILTGTDLTDAATDVAALTKEAAKGATKAAEGATEAATTARAAAKNATDAVAKATSPQHRAILQEVATEATNVAAKADDAAAAAAKAAKTATDAADDANKVVKAFKSGTATRADLVKSMQDSVNAAENAKMAASGALEAAEIAGKVSTIANLATVSETAAETAHNAMSISKGVPKKYPSGFEDALQVALKGPEARAAFSCSSKVVGPQNAAKLMKALDEINGLQWIYRMTFVATLGEAGFMAASGVYRVKTAEAYEQSAVTQKEKTYIMASSEAIDDQSARESEFLAMMQDALSKAIGSLKPQLAKQWRPVTNAIQA